MAALEPPGDRPGTILPASFRLPKRQKVGQGRSLARRGPGPEALHLESPTLMTSCVSFMRREANNTRS